MESRSEDFSMRSPRTEESSVRMREFFNHIHAGCMHVIEPLLHDLMQQRC